MRSLGHLTTTTIVVGIFYFYNPSFPFTPAILFILGSLLIDLDFFLQLILKEKNHRYYLTHNLPMWLLLSFFFFIFDSILFYITIGVCYHLLFDWFDWGLPIIPHTDKLPLTPHLLTITKSDPIENDFRRIYWNNPLIASLEIMFFLLAIFFFIFVSIEIQIILIIALILSIFSEIIIINFSKKI